MTVTLYQPGANPRDIFPKDYEVRLSDGQVVQNVEQAAELLDCHASLVDVLACGAGYVIYSVFDCEGPQNIPAMAAVASVTGIEFDPANDDELLRGPVLVIKT